MYDSTKPYTKRILEIVGDKRVIPASTDGIGTKGIYHWQQRTFRNAALDALAMNLNDMAMLRARATQLQDHIMLPEEDEEAILEIVKNLSLECERRDISILSGETAIHDDFNGLEISVSVSGRYLGRRRENRFEEGDHLVGIRSSGLHSNGFTKVRKVFGDEFREEFTKPTAIYYDAILSLIKKYKLHGMVHITGGAFTKLKPFLGRNNAMISNSHRLSPHEIFSELFKRGISDEEMYKMFNCGIGFVLSVNRTDSIEVISDLGRSNLESDIIGEVVSGEGKVKIKSMFSSNEIVL